MSSAAVVIGAFRGNLNLEPGIVYLFQSLQKNVVLTGPLICSSVALETGNKVLSLDHMNVILTLGNELTLTSQSLWMWIAGQHVVQDSASSIDFCQSKIF